MNRDKKPLYRKENKTSLQTKYYVETGSEYRYTRNSKKNLNSDKTHEPMTSGQHGYDYTPLYKFLLSKVGQEWDKVFSEAKSRLGKVEPIFYLVALHEEDKRDVVNIHVNNSYSGLYVTDEGILEKVNPDAQPHIAICTCHTYSFNGKPIIVKK